MLFSFLTEILRDVVWILTLFLLQGLGLTVDANKPIVVCITRLVPQKGVHLIRHSVHVTPREGGQFVLLGTGHADGDFRAMAEGEFNHHPDVK